MEEFLLDGICRYDGERYHRYITVVTDPCADLYKGRHQAIQAIACVRKYEANFRS